MRKMRIKYSRGINTVRRKQGGDGMTYFDELQITIVATDDYIAKVFRMYFLGHGNVNIHRGIFEELTADCLVSPANSFGLMDGGMDAAITAYFGDQLQERVQQRIIDEYSGEQPVGTSFIIETNNESIPYLAHTPTMRVPANINGTDNVYLATKATLEEVKREGIKSLILPAFGAGAGQVNPQEVARQTAVALNTVKNHAKEIDWEYALFRSRLIRGN